MGSATTSLPANTTIRIVGITNVAAPRPQTTPSQQIVLTPAGGQPITWTATGNQRNHIAGQYVIDAAAGVQSVQVEITYDLHDGNGFQQSLVSSSSYQTSGLSVAMVMGNIAPTPDGNHLYTNAIVLMYWPSPAPPQSYVPIGVI